MTTPMKVVGNPAASTEASIAGDRVLASNTTPISDSGSRTALRAVIQAEGVHLVGLQPIDRVGEEIIAMADRLHEDEDGIRISDSTPMKTKPGSANIAAPVW